MKRTIFCALAYTTCALAAPRVPQALLAWHTHAITHLQATSSAVRQMNAAYDNLQQAGVYVQPGTAANLANGWQEFIEKFSYLVSPETVKQWQAARDAVANRVRS